jgi:tetraacyldisaccharide 4'-kinase
VSHTNQQSFWQRFFLDMWYRKRWWAWLLLPIACCAQWIGFFYVRMQKKQAYRAPVPVVVVGNISVGGTGKTPVIIALANALTAQGITVGVVSRGHGSRAPFYPYVVNSENATAQIVGDEPLLIAKMTNCPIVIDRDRVSAVNTLLNDFPDVNLILSDDGLQHYRLQRDMEVVIVDGERGLGNHLCLPAGPLREPKTRLASVDWVLFNQAHAATDQHSTDDQLATFILAPSAWRHVNTQQVYPLHPLPWLGEQDQHKTLLHPHNIAIAGIGNPQRFFNTLEQLGIDSENHAYDDHYDYTLDDFSQWQDQIVLMTEKDAVKCQSFDYNNLWSLMVDLSLPEAFVQSIVDLVKNTPSN